MTTLEAVRREWQQVKDSIGVVPPDRMDEPGVVGSWSVKDLIGHLAIWDAEALRALRRYIGDRDAEALVTWHDVDGFNAREVATKREIGLDELYRDLDETHLQLVELLSGFTDSELGLRKVQARIRSDTYYHYADHASQIRRWLDTPGPIPEGSDSEPSG